MFFAKLHRFFSFKSSKSNQNFSSCLLDLSEIKVTSSCYLVIVSNWIINLYKSKYFYWIMNFVSEINSINLMGSWQGSRKYLKFFFQDFFMNFLINFNSIEFFKYYLLIFIEFYIWLLQVFENVLLTLKTRYSDWS